LTDSSIDDKSYSEAAANIDMIRKSSNNIRNLLNIHKSKYRSITERRTQACELVTLLHDMLGYVYITSESLTDYSCFQ